MVSLHYHFPLSSILTYVKNFFQKHKTLIHIFYGIKNELLVPPQFQGVALAWTQWGAPAHQAQELVWPGSRPMSRQQHICGLGEQGPGCCKCPEYHCSPEGRSVTWWDCWSRQQQPWVPVWSPSHPVGESTVPPSSQGAALPQTQWEGPPTKHNSWYNIGPDSSRAVSWGKWAPSGCEGPQCCCSPELGESIWVGLWEQVAAAWIAQVIAFPFCGRPQKAAVNSRSGPGSDRHSLWRA